MEKATNNEEKYLKVLYQINENMIALNNNINYFSSELKRLDHKIDDVIIISNNQRLDVENLNNGLDEIKELINSLELKMNNKNNRQIFYY